MVPSYRQFFRCVKQQTEDTVRSATPGLLCVLWLIHQSCTLMSLHCASCHFALIVRILSLCVQLYQHCLNSCIKQYIKDSVRKKHRMELGRSTMAQSCCCRHLLQLLSLISILQVVVAPNPNIQFSWTELIHVDVWSGLPYHNFQIDWYAKLTHSLGTVAQDGYTLLQTAYGVDPGGANYAGAVNAQQQQQHQNREHRLYYAILNKIDPNAWIATHMNSLFASDGSGAYVFVRL